MIHSGKNECNTSEEEYSLNCVVEALENTRRPTDVDKLQHFPDNLSSWGKLHIASQQSRRQLQNRALVQRYSKQAKPWERTAKLDENYKSLPSRKVRM